LTHRKGRPYRSGPNDRARSRAVGLEKGSDLTERVAVEGVEVATEHWIGGERVAASDAFEDVSPIDETTLADVARGELPEHVVELTRGPDAWVRR
jgi:hypothetical protein